jgi:hypothetical protein
MYRIPTDIQYRPGQYLRFADVGGRFMGVEYSVTTGRGVWFRVLSDMSLERVEVR